MLSLKSPLKLKVELSEVILEHPFYYYDENPMFLMGSTSSPQLHC